MRRALLPLAAIPASASAAPLQYLTGSGAKAYPVVGLTWWMLLVSIVVVVLIAAFVTIGVLRRRSPSVAPADTAVGSPAGGAAWIYWGVGITAIALVITLVWTMVVLADVTPPHHAPLTIEVTGRQWWWEARYLGKDPELNVAVPNEIHIPVGQPVRIKLIGADVIHSFWVPQLTGKTDAIPGQTNVTWLEADKPGRYRGQCTEYCGVQHAHMGFYVVAEPWPQFKQWWIAQTLPAQAPATPDAQKGEQLVVYKCGACHSVRGTDAGGTVAPDLTHLMSRQTLAAATLPNTPYGLAGWISNPQDFKPGTNMPTFYLSGPQLYDVLAYLETLK